MTRDRRTMSRFARARLALARAVLAAVNDDLRFVADVTCRCGQQATALGPTRAEALDNAWAMLRRQCSTQHGGASG